MDSAIDLSNPSAALSLPHIRSQLIRLEDSVIFYLIERAQFPLNRTIYLPGAIPIHEETKPDGTTSRPNGGHAHEQISFMDWVLRSQEHLQSRIRRYQSPDEYPFFPDALSSHLVLPELKYPKILWANDVCVNSDLKRAYVDEVLPKICVNTGRKERAEAQENYGSAATADVNCLQALSRRIHFGKFVAESKFLQSPAKFVALIKAEDRTGIDEAITDAKVEKKVLERLRLKAEMYGTDPAMPGVGTEGEGVRKIDVDAVVAMYRDHVIPLTKVVEVEYLMQRLRGTEWE
jgi:chorismate mutase